MKGRGELCWRSGLVTRSGKASAENNGAMSLGWIWTGDDLSWVAAVLMVC